MENEFTDTENAFRELEEYLLFMREHSLPKMDYEAQYFKKLTVIKAYYEAHWDLICRHHAKYRTSLFRAYPFDWCRIFTPIEQSAWESMRIKGGIPLYPQYPVGNYIIDFADPFAKVGLETDGKKWHNAEKDFIRDTNLKQEGWTIYRVSGKEMMRTNFKTFSDVEFIYEYEEPELSDDDWAHIKYWILETGDGVIEAIKRIYYAKSKEPQDKIDADFLSLCRATLYEHQSIK